MIAMIKAKLEASRSLLYETANYVDIYKSLEDIARERTLTPEERQECKRYSRLADALTPLAKGMSSEFANQNAYDCIQIHGGSGFMRDYLCERLYRDASITSIYEGTTQLQVVAAIRYVTNGTYSSMVEEMLSEALPETFEPQRRSVEAMLDSFRKASEAVSAVKDQEWLDFHARRLVEMAAYCVMSTLLLRDAAKNPELLQASAGVFVSYAASQVASHASFIESSDPAMLSWYRR